MADTQRLFDLPDKYKKSLDKVADLQNKLGVEDISDDSDEEGEKNNDDDELTEVLIEKDLLLSESGKCKSESVHNICTLLFELFKSFGVQFSKTNSTFIFLCVTFDKILKQRQ